MIRIVNHKSKIYYQWKYFGVLFIIITLLLVCVIPVSAQTKIKQKKVTIQLRWDNQYQFAGYYSALWQGYYEDAGFDVEIRSAITSDGRILSATKEVTNGNADFGVGAADILLARDQGYPLVVLASIFQQSAAEFYTRDDMTLITPFDLLNLKVARNVNDLIDVELQAMLLSEGLDIKKMVSIPHTSNLEPFINRSVDVIPGYRISAPYELKQNGIGFKTLRPINYGINFYGDSLFTTTRIIENDPEAVERFRQATLKGWEYALDHSIEVADRISKELPRTAKIVSGTFHDFNRSQIVGVKELTMYPIAEMGHINPDRWMRMSKLMTDMGILKKAINMNEFIFDFSSLDKARESKRESQLIITLFIVIGLSIFISIWIVVLRNIVKRKTTELVKAKEVAEEANVAKSQFLANMSHEIRTPMNGLMGIIQLLEITQLTAKQKEYVRISKTSSNALLVVINEILDYSKIEAGKMELEKKAFTLGKVINDELDLFKISAVEKGLIMEVSIARDIPENLIGDPFRLQQIVSNLMGNAVKYTKKGKIDVVVKKIGELNHREIKLEFVVKDTGIGIPTDKTHVLFKSFSQVDNSNTRKYGGTGLGLAISKSLVELMAGEIWVESREGEGSSFYFTCVFGTNGVELESTEPSVDKQIDYPKGNELILLLAEDDAVSRMVVGKMAQGRGWKMTGVENGQAAVDVFQQMSFDVILMDVQMPEMDGYTATRLIRQLETLTNRRTPIIAMTAYALKGDRERCLEAGMDDYLAKPVNVDEFYAVVESWAKNETKV